MDGLRGQLAPEPAVASVTTGAQSVVYSGAAGGGEFGKAAARAAWHRDQRGAQSVPVELARVPGSGRDRGAAVGAGVPVVTITRPQPAALAVSLPPTPAIDVPWPRIRVTGAAAPGAQRDPARRPAARPLAPGLPQRAPAAQPAAVPAGDRGPRVGCRPGRGWPAPRPAARTPAPARPPGQLGPRHAERVGRRPGRASSHATGTAAGPAAPPPPRSTTCAAGPFRTTPGWCRCAAPCHRGHHPRAGRSSQRAVTAPGRGHVGATRPVGASPA